MRLVRSAPATLLLLLLGSQALATPTVEAANCSLALTASSKSEWQVACADGNDGAAATFDPALLTAIRIGDYPATEFKPKTAPQPVEVRVPAGVITKVGELESATLTSFWMQRDATVKKKSTIEFAPTAFAKMTALQKLNIGFFNITVADKWVFPPSLNEITINHGGLTKFDITAVKGEKLNITKIDLRYNNLRTIPSFVFTTRGLVFVDLFQNKIPALRMSKRKLRRFLWLIEKSKILIGSIDDFTEACEDGEKQTVKNHGSNYLICVTPTADDDDLIIDDDGDSAGGSTGGAATSSPTTTGPAATGGSKDSQASSPGGSSTTPSPSKTASSATRIMAVVPLTMGLLLCVTLMAL